MWGEGEGWHFESGEISSRPCLDKGAGKQNVVCDSSSIPSLYRTDSLGCVAFELIVARPNGKRDLIK